jgi:hypothetical protein
VINPASGNVPALRIIAPPCQQQETLSRPTLEALRPMSNGRCGNGRDTPDRFLRWAE